MANSRRTTAIPTGSSGIVPSYVKTYDPLFRRSVVMAPAMDGSKMKYPIQHKFGRDSGVWTIPKLLKVTGLGKEMSAELLKVRRAFKRDPETSAQHCRIVEDQYWGYVKSQLKEYIKWLGRVFYKEIGLKPRMEGIPVNGNADDNEYYIQYFENDGNVPVVFTDRREFELSVCVAEKGVRPSWRKREDTVKTMKQFLKHCHPDKAMKHRIEMMARGEDVPNLLYEGS